MLARRLCPVAVVQHRDFLELKFSVKTDDEIYTPIRDIREEEEMRHCYCRRTSFLLLLFRESTILRTLLKKKAS